MASQSFSQLVNTKEVLASIQNTMTAKQAADFKTAIITLYNTADSLRRCSPTGIIQAGLNSVKYNFPLDNNLGFCYVVPYKWYAQFQIGWRGYVQLAQRTGQYLCINVTDVKQGEYLGFDIASGRPKLGEPAENREDLPDVGYLAYFKLLNGAEYFYYQTRQQIEAFKNKYSPAANCGPWVSNFSEMARKTVLKHLLKNFGPLTAEVASALKADSLNYQGNRCGYDVPNLQTEIVLPTLKSEKEPDKAASEVEQIEASAETAAPVAETEPEEAAPVPPAKSIRESTKEAADLFTEKIKGALKS
jgi:recombination protein RecT